jgi:DNA-binding XRE family transcriptional regulator
MDEPGNEAIGARIRELRAISGLSMRELASRAGVSPGYISQIENGQKNASIAVIRAIADDFGINWLELFQPAPRHGRVLRRTERPRIYSDGGVAHFGITQPPVRSVEVLVSEYEPGRGTGDEHYTHGDSQEICLVTRGRLTVTIDGEQHHLDVGDSVELRTSTPHHVLNPGPDTAEAVWVVTPPAFPAWGQTTSDS